MNIDDRPTHLSLENFKWPLSAAGHPTHFMYVRPLQFALGLYNSLLTQD